MYSFSVVDLVSSLVSGDVGKVNCFVVTGDREGIFSRLAIFISLAGFEVGRVGNEAAKNIVLNVL